LAETDASGKIQKIYINDGARIIGMVKYVYKPDGTFSHYMPMYYMFDSLGSVSAITAETGKPLQMYKYTPYGKVTNTIDDSENALRFIGAYGGYQDDDTGFIYFWHRWYDAQNGRWVSRDPIGVRGGINLFAYINIIGKLPSLNFYQYVENRAFHFIDSYGLCPNGPEMFQLPIPTMTQIPSKPSLTNCYVPIPIPSPTPCSDDTKMSNCINYCDALLNKK
jgi:RHS repeat-associated protein